jgi:gas vesicle protein
MKAYLYVLLMGVGIGILIAPDKGSNTRKKIMKAMDDLLEEGEEALDIDAPKMEPLKY